MGLEFKNLILKEYLGIESSIIHRVNHILNNGYLANVKIHSLSKEFIRLKAVTHHYDYISQLTESLKQYKPLILEYHNYLTNQKINFTHPEYSKPADGRDTSFQIEEGTLVGTIKCHYQLDNKTKEDCDLDLQILVFKNKC